jgi:uncharacterized membrane protein
MRIWRVVSPVDFNEQLQGKSFMDFYRLLVVMHIGMALVLFSVALTSVMIAVLSAVKPDPDQANVKLVDRGNIIGLMENMSAIVVTLTGVILVFMGSWSWSQLWLWLSLVVMAFYSIMLTFITRPARLAVAKGGSAVKAGMQVLFQVAHVLLLIVTFAFMLLKPF